MLQHEREHLLRDFDLRIALHDRARRLDRLRQLSGLVLRDDVVKLVVDIDEVLGVVGGGVFLRTGRPRDVAEAQKLGFLGGIDIALDVLIRGSCRGQQFAECEQIATIALGKVALLAGITGQVVELGQGRSMYFFPLSIIPTSGAQPRFSDAESASK